MSTWNMHEVSVTLASDLHCGDLPLGFISRTLPFVPSHLPWYALVNATTRSMGKSADKKTYAMVEKLFLQGIRFSPFYIVEQDGPLFPFIPKHLNKIEKDYLNSSYGVALDYENREALENRLFERECILSKSRKTGHPTELKGYLFYRQARSGALRIDDQAKIGPHFLTSLLANTQWGGERNKGWGSLQRVELSEATDNLFGFSFNLENKYPQIKIDKENSSPFFLAWENNQYNRVQGELRPLTGRRFKLDVGSGMSMDRTLIVWDVGWEALEDVIINLIDHRAAAIVS